MLKDGLQSEAPYQGRHLWRMRELCSALYREFLQGTEQVEATMKNLICQCMCHVSEHTQDQFSDCCADTHAVYAAIWHKCFLLAEQCIAAAKLREYCGQF